MKKVFNFKMMPVRSKILIIVISFWAIPLLIIGIYSIFFYSNSINSRINEYLQNQYFYYNEFAAEKLNAVVDASKKATYDLVIENAYSQLVSWNRPWEYFFNQVDGYLREKYYLDKKYIMSAFFLADDTTSININSRVSNLEIKYYKENIHKRAVEMSKNLETDVGFIIVDNRAYVIRNMMMVRGPYKCFGTIVLQIDPDYLLGHMIDGEDGLKSIAISLNDSVLRYDIGYDGHAKAPEDNLTQTLLNTSGSYIQVDDTNVSFYSKQKTDDYSIGLAVVLDKDTIYSKYRNLRNIIYFIAFLTIPCVVYVLYFLHKNVSKPIQKLVEATGDIRNGNFGFYLDENDMTNYEFKIVANSFNSMSMELKRLFDYVYKEELALKDAKILALQSQINPHFLGNTLEMMNWQARMAGDDEVSNMIEALSVLLDSSMDRSNRKLIPLSKEIETIDAYLYIISKRFGKRITIEKDIDDKLLSHMVPRLILQPLIENAVIHGIEPVHSGTITVRVYKSKGHLIINIINNGKEIEDSELEQINSMLDNPSDLPKSGHLGLRNVNERIRLIYGDQYRLVINKDSSGRTVAEIKIPLDDTL